MRVVRCTDKTGWQHRQLGKAGQLTTAPPLLSSGYTDWKQHQSVHRFYKNKIRF